MITLACEEGFLFNPSSVEGEGVVEVGEEGVEAAGSGAGEAGGGWRRGRMEAGSCSTKCQGSWWWVWRWW